MVHESDTAWHAGVVSPDSILANKGNPNTFCIGIEFARNKKNDNIMPDIQISSGMDLVNDIRARHPDISTYFHDEISIGRICPGPNFPKAIFRPE
jgi:N-acetyl-anhydromuramyl-L-alanine amidase AmpD